MRILVVEDNAAIRAMLQAMLTEEGHLVIESNGAGNVMPFIRASLPDVIILDLGLPGLAGEEVLLRLSQDAATRSIAVIVSSAWEERMKQAQYDAQQRAQSVFLLPKPYGMRDLLAKLTEALKPPSTNDT